MSEVSLALESRTATVASSGNADALGQSNMGHKLLSMMGWSGGGLGKDGGGRAEPVTATTVFGRSAVWPCAPDPHHHDFVGRGWETRALVNISSRRSSRSLRSGWAAAVPTTWSSPLASTTSRGRKCTRWPGGSTSRARVLGRATIGTSPSASGW